jgi:hypothetical protein
VGRANGRGRLGELLSLVPHPTNYLMNRLWDRDSRVFSRALG